MKNCYEKFKVFFFVKMIIIVDDQGKHGKMLKSNIQA